jgi:phage FluMu protein Com
MRKPKEISMKAVRIEELMRSGEAYHKILCPYCRRVMIFAVKSNLYPKGPTMRCTECKQVFKKFHRPLYKEP